MKQVYYWLDSFTTAVNDLLQYIYGINLLHLTHVDVLWLTETVKWLSKFRCAILDHPISNTLMQHKYRHLLRLREDFSQDINRTEAFRKLNTKPKPLDQKPLEAKIQRICTNLKSLLDYTVNHSHTFDNLVEMSTALQHLTAIVSFHCPVRHSHMKNKFTDLPSILQLLGIIHNRISQITNILHDGYMSRVVPQLITIINRNII